MPGSDFSKKRKTCKRFNLAGHAHALTFCCFQRRQFFSKPRSCLWFLDALDRARNLLHFDVWAYVIMPEHCHLLIYPRESVYSTSRILEAIKLPVTRRARAYLQKNNPAAFAVDGRPATEWQASLPLLATGRWI